MDKTYLPTDPQAINLMCIRDHVFHYIPYRQELLEMYDFSGSLPTRTLSTVDFDKYPILPAGTFQTDGNSDRFTVSAWGGLLATSVPPQSVDYKPIEGTDSFIYRVCRVEGRHTCSYPTDLKEIKVKQDSEDPLSLIPSSCIGLEHTGLKEAVDYALPGNQTLVDQVYKRDPSESLERITCLNRAESATMLDGRYQVRFDPVALTFVRRSAGSKG
jgi:hypothetical protein